MSVPPIVTCVTVDELNDQARAIFEGFTANGGAVPKWLQVMANCPDTMVGFFSLFKSLMDNAPVPATLKWKVAYVVSEINKCAFCIGAADSKLKELGITEDELRDIDNPTDDKERLAVAYARATTEHAYAIEPDLITRMQETFTDEEIVEITAVIGLFNFINRFNDALRVLPDTK